jgi:O-acetyl-ADP-ribose deacetylase (regulator of RNase III)
MRVEVLVGDVLDVPADVLVSTANPWLQMTGGVNLKIILRPRGEFVHEELQRHLRASGRLYVEPGTVVRTGPGSLPVRHILHAVSIDPSYDSSVGLVADTITKALTQARELDARTVTMPALATGFGPLSMEEFGVALSRALARDWSPLAVLTVVLRQQEDADTVRAVLARSPGQPDAVAREARPSPEQARRLAEEAGHYVRQTRLKGIGVAQQARQLADLAQRLQAD